MKLIQIKGQISLFDDQPKTINIPLPKEETKDNPVFLNLIYKYRNLCARIARVEDKLYIEIDDKTLSFKQDGELSGIFIKDMLLRPKDEIIVANDQLFFANKDVDRYINGEMDKGLIKTLMIKNREDRFNCRKNPIDKWFGDNIPTIK